ncbi:MAG: DUF4174 domain-containing protein [Paracoccus sp. (in: a-proteobacteria)]|nr:DUF4174 domain-containing protein [Paracoccus sp. (in: a-proteobacteria)]
MRRKAARATITATFIAAFGVSSALADAPAPGDLSPHLARQSTIAAMQGQARPIVILGKGNEIQAQLNVLWQRAEELRARDVVILTNRPGAIALGPGLTEGFAVLLLGMDGEIKLSQSSPVSAETVIEVIDSMPMRQNELTRSSAGLDAALNRAQDGATTSEISDSATPGAAPDRQDSPDQDTEMTQ